MRVLCAPDSLKAVLSSGDAADALVAGLARVPHVEGVPLAVADGGEGSAAAIEAARGGEWFAVTVDDPLGRPTIARYLVLADGTAVVEAAQAIGLDLVAPRERDPIRASSAGLGQLLTAVLARGPRELVVTLGGTATVDGGRGLRENLDAERLKSTRLRVACDVRSPLLGPDGAAGAFGPQKGASSRQVVELERRLAGMPELQPYADRPGAGAAGGLGAALAALGGELVPGAELILDIVEFDRRLGDACAAITGEGGIDRTSMHGKLPAVVCARCAEAGVDCIVFGGTVDGDARQLYEQGATAVFSLSGRPERAEADLIDFGEAVGRLLVARAR